MSDLYSQVANALASLPDSIWEIIEVVRINPPPNSQVERELKQCPMPQHLEPAYTQAQSAVFHVAADHIRAVSRELTPRALTYSPWASARCVLEACSRAYWLSDTKINHTERASRILNIRLQNVKNSVAYIRSTENLHNGFSAKQIKQQEKRIDYLRSEANKLNILEKLDRRKRFLGFGNGMPSYTDLATSVFEAGDIYGLFAGATHGQEYTSVLSTQLLEDTGEGDGKNRILNITEESALLIGSLVIEWFAKAAWEVFKIHGWNMKALATILENTYDEIGVKNTAEIRFWRKDYLTTIGI